MGQSHNDEMVNPAIVGRKLPTKMVDTWADALHWADEIYFQQQQQRIVRC